MEMLLANLSLYIIKSLDISNHRGGLETTKMAFKHIDKVNVLRQ